MMVRTSTSRDDSTAERILDVAERLVQTRGLNRVSYADTAAELGSQRRVFTTTLRGRLRSAER
jgi:AcrR family transcriptional regulator